MRHNRSNLTTRLPADYVRASTGLGYAITIHAAQGVTADTMHGLITGQESRQQLYTMLTRGRPRITLPAGRRRRRPAHPYPTRHRRTPHPDRNPQQILARDEAPASASTPPATQRPSRAGCSTPSSATPTGSRYPSSSSTRSDTLDDQADNIVPSLTSEPSWPTLRAHLLALAAETGEHPLLHLYEAALGGISHG